MINSILLLWYFCLHYILLPPLNVKTNQTWLTYSLTCNVIQFSLLQCSSGGYKAQPNSPRKYKHLVTEIWLGHRCVNHIVMVQRRPLDTRTTIWTIVTTGDDRTLGRDRGKEGLVSLPRTPIETTETLWIFKYTKIKKFEFSSQKNKVCWKVINVHEGIELPIFEQK